MLAPVSGVHALTMNVGGQGGATSGGYNGGAAGSSSGTYGGGGGGLTEVKFDGSVLAVAGAGGGAPAVGTNSNGGIGGGTTGGAGLYNSAYDSTRCGSGGTQSAGGAGSTTGPGSAGASYTGGTAASAGGGGGAGYYGGGGGGNGGGGGGGSSYVVGSLGSASISKTSTLPGCRVGNGLVTVYYIQEPQVPTTPGATAIGQHTITWAWVDASTYETGYKVYADPGSNAPTTLQTTTADDVSSYVYGNNSLLPNTQHTFQVAATNSGGDSAKTAAFSAWTLAATPAAPVVNGAAANSLNVSVGTGDGNPTGTEYGIYCTTTSQWVQTGGTLGTSAAWQTAAAWGTKTVTGLSQFRNYTFTVTARNGSNVETAASTGTTLKTLGNTAPVVTLTGPGEVMVTRCTEYTELGASVTDAEDGGPAAWPAVLPGGVWTVNTGSLNMQIPGTYMVTYRYTDSGSTSGVPLDSVVLTRIITVANMVAPVIQLLGSPAVTAECGTTYSDAAATASDACGIDLTSHIIVGGNQVNPAVPGTYSVTYNVADAYGLSADQVARTVTVADTAPPVITLSGASPATVECHSTYSDAGATASDFCAGNPAVATSGTVNTSVVGSYTLTYTTNDGSGNNAVDVTRTVNVVDTTPPVINACTGNQTVSANASCQAPVPNFTASLAASDSCGGVTVTQSPTAGTSVGLGNTIVTLSVTDEASNFATCTATLTVLPGACNPTTIPNVVGLSQTAAEAALINAHLVVGRLSSHCGDADIPGLVMGQLPAASDAPVPSYSAVNLVVSQGRCHSGECLTP